MSKKVGAQLFPILIPNDAFYHLDLVGSHYIQFVVSCYERDASSFPFKLIDSHFQAGDSSCHKLTFLSSLFALSEMKLYKGSSFSEITKAETWGTVLLCATGLP